MCSIVFVRQVSLSPVTSLLDGIWGSQAAKISIVMPCGVVGGWRWSRHVYNHQQDHKASLPRSQSTVCWMIIVTTHNYKMVRFQVLTAASMKMAIFWDVAPCSLVEVYRRFSGACCLHHQGKHLWNVGKLLPDYTAQHPRRQLSSFLQNVCQGVS
jgi:hypothetical protein